MCFASIYIYVFLSLFIYILVPTPLHEHNETQGKNLAELIKFEFRVFSHLDWLPYQS